jgi:hypothetical protein
MDKDWDSLLEEGPLEVPDNFAHLVMLRVRHASVPPARSSLLEKLQNLALIAGGVLGFAQLATFMFGVWFATTTG